MRCSVLRMPPVMLRFQKRGSIIPESAQIFMAGLIARARKLKKTIVFPEGNDPRVLQAAARLVAEGVVKPVLIGTAPATPIEGVVFVDPARSSVSEKYAALYYER